jgi:hypothetical protein
MSTILAAIAVCVFVIALFVALAVSVRLEWRREEHGRRRRRAEIEPQLYTYVAADGPLPARPKRRAERRTFRAVAYELLESLDDPERSRLTDCLEQHGLVWDAVRELGSRFPYRRRRAADELALTRSVRAAPALRRALSDRNEEVRLECARALAEIGEGEYLDELPAVLEQASRFGSGVASVLISLAEREPGRLAALCEATESAELRSTGLVLLGEGRQ